MNRFRNILTGFLLLGLSVQLLNAQPRGLTIREPMGAFLNDTFPKSAPGIVAGGYSTVEAFPNLTFDDPVSLLSEPNSDRLYVCERQGTIRFFTNNPATSTKVLFLDLTPVTQGYDDCGLMSMAFHPEFGQTGSTNRGYVYVYYQYSPAPTSGPGRPPSATPGYNRLSRFTVPDGSLVADPGSELVLINQFDRHVWHNGGGMFFGGDGFLYLTNGDEGAANDSYNQTQQINNRLFSGMLRIDVNQDSTKSHPIRRQPATNVALPSGWTLNSFTGNYYIPNDNPWLDPGGGILEEFWAIGLRSPHRATRDPVSGKIFYGDVGQGSWEEVAIIEKGDNHQWPYREGARTGPKAKPSPLIGTDKPPIWDYGHTNGNNCVIGGYVYRGSKFPEFQGKYIFGDNGSGRRIWILEETGGYPANVTEIAVLTQAGSNYSGLSSFGVDRHNEIYLCKMGRPSTIYKLERNSSSAPEPPATLSATGAFSDLNSMTVSTGIVPYDVNAPLWSDNAAKSRWMAVPSTNQVGFNPTGIWDFPVGTVFIKHFELPIDDTNPALRVRLETRFLILGTNNTWYGVTYKWRNDQTDADLLTTGATQDYVVTTPTGTRTQTWDFPSRADCLTCHNPNSGQVLGLKTHQLNRNLTYPQTGNSDNQIRALNHVGFFTATLNESAIPGYPKSFHIEDITASNEQRVRSWLDANCAHCHRPGGVQAYFDARFDTPIENQALINGPVVDDLGIVGARVIYPQDLNRSLLYQRDNSLAAIKMPPLAKNMVHTQAMQVLADWINSLPPPAGLPAPWAHQDVGAVNIAGDATHGSGTFTITGSGADIWNTADGFHYVYQSWTGDGTIVARVNSQVNTDVWAKSGVMFRESFAPGSKHAMTVVTPGNGTAFQRRAATDGASTHTVGPAQTAPYWVRLIRSGNTFTGAVSPDGVTWTTIGNESIAMNATVYVGLCVTSHNNNALNTANFSNVSVIIPGGPFTPTITWNNPGNAVYGTALSSVQLNASANVPGSFAYTPASGAVLNAGNSQTLSVMFTPSDPVNYTSANKSVAINITKASLSITAQNKSKIYGQPNPLLTADYAGFVNGDSSASLDTPPSITTPATQFSDAGNHAITAAGAVDANYAITHVNGTLTINKANSEGALAVSANPAVPGNPVTLTTTVTATAPGNGTPSGSVQFLDGGTPLGAPVSLTGGSAQLTTSALSVGTHTITATYAGDGNFNTSSAALDSTLIINTPPVAGPDHLTRPPQKGVKVRRSSLTANDSDADSHTLTFQNLAGTSAGGGTVTVLDPWIFYQPPGGDAQSDSFSYEIADPLGGLDTGTVTITREAFTGTTDNLEVTDLGNGSFQIFAHGIPSTNYQLEFTDASISPAWQPLTGTMTDGLGRTTYVDTPPGGSPARTYRMIQP